MVWLWVVLYRKFYLMVQGKEKYRLRSLDLIFWLMGRRRRFSRKCWFILKIGVLISKLENNFYFDTGRKV
jgi:hypothetical protein